MGVRLFSEVVHVCSDDTADGQGRLLVMEGAMDSTAHVLVLYTYAYI